MPTPIDKLIFPWHSSADMLTGSRWTFDIICDKLHEIITCDNEKRFVQYEDFIMTLLQNNPRRFNVIQGSITDMFRQCYENVSRACEGKPSIEIVRDKLLPFIARLVIHAKEILTNGTVYLQCVEKGRERTTTYFEKNPECYNLPNGVNAHMGITSIEAATLLAMHFFCIFDIYPPKIALEYVSVTDIFCTQNYDAFESLVNYFYAMYCDKPKYPIIFERRALAGPLIDWEKMTNITMNPGALDGDSTVPICYNVARFHNVLVPVNKNLTSVYQAEFKHPLVYAYIESILASIVCSGVCSDLNDSVLLIHGLHQYNYVRVKTSRYNNGMYEVIEDLDAPPRDDHTKTYKRIYLPKNPARTIVFADTCALNQPENILNYDDVLAFTDLMILAFSHTGTTSKQEDNSHAIEVYCTGVPRNIDASEYFDNEVKVIIFALVAAVTGSNLLVCAQGKNKQSVVNMYDWFHGTNITPDRIVFSYAVLCKKMRHKYNLHNFMQLIYHINQSSQQ